MAEDIPVIKYFLCSLIKHLAKAFLAGIHKRATQSKLKPDTVSDVRIKILHTLNQRYRRWMWKGEEQKGKMKIMEIPG